jgi:hypothetical protein
MLEVQALKAHLNLSFRNRLDKDPISSSKRYKMAATARAELLEAERDVAEHLEQLIGEHREQLGAPADATAPEPRPPSRRAASSTMKYIKWPWKLK